jgi:hypothetical protein
MQSTVGSTDWTARVVQRHERMSGRIGLRLRAPPVTLIAGRCELRTLFCLAVF